MEQVTYPVTLRKLREMAANKQYADLTIEKLSEYIGELMYGKEQTRQIKIWPLGPGAWEALHDAMKEESRRFLSDLSHLH